MKEEEKKKVLITLLFWGLCEASPPAP